MTTIDAHKMMSMAQILLTEQRVKPLFGLMVRTSLALTAAHDSFLLLPGQKNGWLLASHGTLEHKDSPRTFAPREVTEKQVPWTLLRAATAETAPVQVESPLNRNVYSRDPYFKANAIRDALAHPLRWSGRLQAMLYLERGAGAPRFSEPQLRQLTDMAGHMAFALANLDQSHFIDSRVQDLEAEVGDVTRALEAKKKQVSISIADAQADARAKFASNVLHKLGNEINSVSLLSDILDEQGRESRIHKFFKANRVLSNNLHHLADFLTNDPKGKLLPEYYLELGNELQREHADFTDDLKRLRDQVALVKDILDKERDLARLDMDLNTVDPAALVTELFQLETERLPFGLVKLIQPPRTHLVRCQRVHAQFVMKYLIKKVTEALEPLPAEERELSIKVNTGKNHKVVLSLVKEGLKPPKTPIISLLPDDPTRGDADFFNGLREALTALHQYGIDVYVSPGQSIAQFAITFPAVRT